MWALLKAFPIGHYVIMAAIAAAVWMYGDLVLTKAALEDQRELTAQYQRIAETQAAIQQRDTVIIRAGEDAERAIQEAPNANTPVPADIAIPWAAGIDSVRDAGTQPADGHVMSRPSSPKTERTQPNLLGVDAVFDRSGTRFLEV